MQLRVMIAAIALPLTGSLVTTPPVCRTFGRLVGSSTSGHGVSTTPTSRNAATGALFSVGEEEALEQQGAAHLPPWSDIPFSESFDQLEGQLTSPKFADEAWEKSQELLRSVLVELASCAARSEEDDPDLAAAAAVWHNAPTFYDGGHENAFAPDGRRPGGADPEEAPTIPEDPYLPLQHAAALSLVGRLGERARGLRAGEEGAPVDLSSCLKYSTKKNGVAGAATEVAEGVLPKFESAQERLAVIRGVERCVSEFCLVWSTARLLDDEGSPPKMKRDFVFHLRPLLEHSLSASDRFESVLVLCRGLFTPGYNKEASRVHDNVHGVALRQERGGCSLEEAFAEVQRGTVDTPAALRAARQAFPFLEMLARWAWRCKLDSAAELEAKKKKAAPRVRFVSKKVKRAQAAAAAALAAAAEEAAAGEEGEGRSEEDEAGAGAAGSEQEATASASAAAGSATRSRDNTGVASLLVALAKADPSGDTIRSLRRWSCEAILPEEMKEAPALSTPTSRNEVAQGIISTHRVFVSGKKAQRQRYARACREVGEVLRLLVATLDEEKLEGKDVTSMVNHALFATAFLRPMPLGATERKGYEILVSGGRTPGAVKGQEFQQFSTRVTNWREAAPILDSGLASILKATSQATAQSGTIGQALSTLLSTWQSPCALADYYAMHRKDPDITRLYVRFLRALLGLSEETVRDIRAGDPSNLEHMRRFPAAVRRQWEAEPQTLSGTVDPQAIFRMGDDTRSCMGIRRSSSATNRALLGYLLQGNARLVGVYSSDDDNSGSSFGKGDGDGGGGHRPMEARAVLRLLVRSDNMAPVLYMDPVYYASKEDPALEQLVLAEARSVSKAVDIPLYRAGDRIPRVELTEAQELEEREAKAAAAAAAAAAASEQGVTQSAGTDPGVFAGGEEGEGWWEEEDGEGGDGSGDTDAGATTEGFLEAGTAFEAGVARYPEKTEAPPYVEPLDTCDLVEVDGLSPWVYADGSHNAALVDPAGVLQRGEGAMGGSHPGAERTVVLATLEYEEKEQ